MPKTMKSKLWLKNAKSRKFLRIWDRTNSKAMVIVFGPVSTFSRISWREGKKGWYKLDVVEADANISNVCNCQSVKRLSSCGMISLTDHRWLRTNVSRTEPWNKFWLIIGKNLSIHFYTHDSVFDVPFLEKCAIFG